MKCNFKFTHAESVSINDVSFVEVHYTCVKCGNQRFKRISPLINIDCEVTE
ncbi:MAG: hypothetical protein ACPGYS_04310 [Flavobacteriales bacterium]